MFDELTIQDARPILWLKRMFMILFRAHFSSDSSIFISPAIIWRSSIRGRGTVLKPLYSLRKRFPNFNRAPRACALWELDVRSGAVFHHRPCARWKWCWRERYTNSR